MSTTTRSARLPDLANDLDHIALDRGRVKVTLAGCPAAAGDEGVEASLPLIGSHRPDSLRVQPGTDRFAYELGDRHPPCGTDSPQRVELLVGEVDVRASHRPYIIHFGPRGLDRREVPSGGSWLAFRVRRPFTAVGRRGAARWEALPAPAAGVVFEE